MEDGPLAEKLAYLHNANGYGVATPFLEDHNTRIVHDNIREFALTVSRDRASSAQRMDQDDVVTQQ